ncbi:hypothetical protein FI667_g4486, partial [Globisporangium splendens]
MIARQGRQSGFTTSSVDVVRTAEDVSHARITSKDHIALQFYWQGYDAYVHCKHSESVAPCFFNTNCVGQASDNEFIHIVPVEETRERSILDEMRVQLVSVSTGKYLRATRVSKFLKWSSSRDEQTVFQIQIMDRKPLTQGSKFTFASTFWPGFYVGFTQTLPLGGNNRELAKAIGFLTLEKKKHQPPLLFPIRFRAVIREFRNLRPASSPSQHADVPTPFVTANDMVFIDGEHEERVANVPLATVVPAHPGVVIRENGSFVGPEQDDSMSDACPYCNVLFRQRAGLMAHIRDYHGDWLHRPSVEGTFCVNCGQRRTNGVCTRCPP